MMITIYISKKCFISVGKLNIFIYIIVSGISYIFAVFILKIEEMRDLFKLFFKYLKLK